MCMAFTAARDGPCRTLLCVCQTGRSGTHLATAVRQPSSTEQTAGRCPSASAVLLSVVRQFWCLPLAYPWHHPLTGKPAGRTRLSARPCTAAQADGLTCNALAPRVGGCVTYYTRRGQPSLCSARHDSCAPWTHSPSSRWHGSVSPTRAPQCQSAHRHAHKPPSEIKITNREHSHPSRMSGGIPE